MNMMSPSLVAGKAPSTTARSGAAKKDSRTSGGSSSPIKLLRRIWIQHHHNPKKKSSSRSQSTLHTALSEDDMASLHCSSSLPNTVIPKADGCLLFPEEIEVICTDNENSTVGNERSRRTSLAEATTKTSAADATTALDEATKSHLSSSEPPRKEEEDDPIAREHFQKAMSLVSSHQWDRALQEAQQGLQQLPDCSSSMYWKLLTVQAEVHGRTGDYLTSLAIYERVLEHATTTSSSTWLVSSLSSLYYACGRLCVYLRDYASAVRYYTAELVHTRQALADDDSLAVARIYHDLARVAQCGVGDWEQAVVYYRQALSIEVVVWKRNQLLLQQLPVDSVDRKQREEDLQEAACQIEETRKCMGRIQFALGEIDEAMRLSSTRFTVK